MKRFGYEAMIFYVGERKLGDLANHGHGTANRSPRMIVAVGATLPPDHHCLALNQIEMNLNPRHAP